MNERNKGNSTHSNNNIIIISFIFYLRCWLREYRIFSYILFFAHRRLFDRWESEKKIGSNTVHCQKEYVLNARKGKPHQQEIEIKIEIALPCHANNKNVKIIIDINCLLFFLTVHFLISIRFCLYIFFWVLPAFK